VRGREALSRTPPFNTHCSHSRTIAFFRRLARRVHAPAPVAPRVGRVA
jgi:hypothetical protein